MSSASIARGCASVSSNGGRPFIAADFDNWLWSDETMSTSNTPLTNAALDAELGAPDSMAVLLLCRKLERKLNLARIALRACASELPDRCEHQRELARAAAADEPLDVEGPDTHFLCR